MFRIKIVMLLLFCILAFGGVSDDSRLMNKDFDHTDWVTYGQGHANQRYSRLDQITKQNVSTLRPAWIFQTGVLGTFPVNPLVVDGVMYISTPLNHVFAVNAVTGEEIWRYTHATSQEKLCCGSHNRGVAWGYG
ncbi:MAG TPA: pyrrolo-quinoline quinone, partial [Dehalococcoidia bacterium]|nr:pyrrolo-quinoline quinone [Dehalococcoidia bacterium]